MSKITVYYFKKWDIYLDKNVQSKSMATFEKINEIQGALPLLETAKEVDTSNLDPDGFYQEKKQ